MLSESLGAARCNFRCDGVRCVILYNSLQAQKMLTCGILVVFILVAKADSIDALLAVRSILDVEPQVHGLDGELSVPC